MTLSLTDAKSILETPKRLTNIHQWIVARNREGCAQVLKFEARIEIDGVLPRGVWFRSIVIPQYTDTATFQLDCDQPSNRSHIPLYRLEWRPFRSHTNGNNGPEELRGLFFPAGTTHEHNCLDHASHKEGRILSGGVQTARKIEPDLVSFAEALRRACDILLIMNHEAIPPPKVQGELF